jgi:Immunity protein 7
MTIQKWNVNSRIYSHMVEYHGWVAGNTNHRSQAIQDVFDLYAYISSVAPGSYGILYMHDDEEIGFENEFRVYVLTRGNLTVHKDPFLSPYFPVVEDEYNGQ